MIELSDSGWPHSTSPFKGDPPLNTVGVVIPVRDGLKFLKLCVYSVLYFTFPPYTLTVVDNQSGLRTKKYLRSLAQNHPVGLLRHDEEFSFAAQVNLGLRHAFSSPGVRFGLILNADTVVEPDWLTLLLETMQREKELGLVGPVSNVGNPEQSRPRADKTFESPRLSGFCMLIRRETFEGLGGFDEGFKGGGFEDWDFCVRARAAGWRIRVDQRVHVHHFHRAFRRHTESNAQMNTNERRFFELHPEIAGEVVRTPKNERAERPGGQNGRG
ncbi:MAG: glycosyltransferase family 2 protein [Elusimicrobia bacterium]|nr:glycosyltransferase family 2 protein [Elusimicrobiota bacterium]